MTELSLRLASSPRAASAARKLSVGRARAEYGRCPAVIFTCKKLATLANLVRLRCRRGTGASLGVMTRQFLLGAAALAALAIGDPVRAADAPAMPAKAPVRL